MTARLPPSLPMTAPDGSLTYGLLSPDAQRYVPAAQVQREQLFALNSGRIAWPEWAPLTTCHNPADA